MCSSLAFIITTFIIFTLYIKKKIVENICDYVAQIRVTKFESTEIEKLLTWIYSD